jgi:Flp pilus assembly CpaF family ATPase
MMKYKASVEQVLQQNSNPVMDLVMCMLHSVTNAHILHLSTTSYAAHKALESFYTEIGDLVDDFVEAYQGKYGLLTDYRPIFTLAEEPVSYMMYLKDELKRCRNSGNFPQDSELQNIADEIAALIDSTLYKLRFLK